MAEIDSQTHKRSDDQDVANSGFIRPPVVYLIAILAGLGLDLVRPLRWLPAEIGIWVGIPLVIASLVLFFSSARRFKAADTPVPGNKPTTAIVRSGPYRFSRNPIYLAFSILMLGIACWRNSGWVLATLGGAAGVMSFVVIPREERYLQRQFGIEYLEYKAKVRRWLQLINSRTVCPGIRCIELTPEYEVTLQRFLDANPLYSLSVTGEPSSAGEAHEEIHGALPAGWPFTRKWLVGYLDQSGALVAMTNIVSDLLARGVWHIGLFIAKVWPWGSARTTFVS